MRGGIPPARLNPANLTAKWASREDSVPGIRRKKVPLERCEARRGIARGAPPALRATSPLRWGGKGTPLCANLSAVHREVARRTGAREGPDCHVDPLRGLLAMTYDEAAAHAGLLAMTGAPLYREPLRRPLPSLTKSASIFRQIPLPQTFTCPPRRGGI